MGISTPASVPVGRGRRSANERWKGRWSTWVARSTIVGAVVHALVLLIWPMWEIAGRGMSTRSELVQIDPLLAYGALREDGSDAIAAQPMDEEVAPELTPRGEGGSELDIADLLALYGDITPTVVRPVLPSAAYGERSRPLPPLMLDFLGTLSPQLTAQPLTVILPIIRNPSMLQRFLRARYNPLSDRVHGGGHVSVAMWINERGSVEWAAVSQSSGHLVLDEIALAVFNDVVDFAPARREGIRVPVSLVISVPFTAPW